MFGLRVIAYLFIGLPILFFSLLFPPIFILWGVVILFYLDCRRVFERPTSDGPHHQPPSVPVQVIDVPVAQESIAPAGLELEAALPPTSKPPEEALAKPSETLSTINLKPDPVVDPLPEQLLSRIDLP